MKRHCPYEKAHLPLALKNKPRPHLYGGRGYHVEVYVSQQLRMYIFTLCTYLKLHTPLVQIYLDSSLSGHLSEVSPVKLSKDKKESISTSQSKMITVFIGVFAFSQRNMHCLIFPNMTILE